MDEIFRLRRYYRNLGGGGLVVYSAWAAIAFFVALTDLEIRHRLGAAAVMGGVPLVMGGMSFWLLLAYRRAALTIRGEHVVDRGVVWSSEIDLAEVTEARWRLRPVGGSILLRSPSARVSIGFAGYTNEERDRMIRHLRSVLRPDVQTGWNLFIYKHPFLKPPSSRLEPGPDEILMSRSRWDRYLWPALAVAGVTGTMAWRCTGELRFLLGPLPVLLGLWAFLRFSTPAEGMVARKFSTSRDRDLVHFLGFYLLWLLVGVAGWYASIALGPEWTPSNVVLVVGAALWLGVFLFQGVLLDRRKSRRDHEAAEQAAAARDQQG